MHRPKFENFSRFGRTQFGPSRSELEYYFCYKAIGPVKISGSNCENPRKKQESEVCAANPHELNIPKLRKKKIKFSTHHVECTLKLNILSLPFTACYCGKTKCNEHFHRCSWFDAPEPQALLETISNITVHIA
jgi:hypothetical protein